MDDRDMLHTVLWLVAELNITRDLLKEVRERKEELERYWHSTNTPLPSYAACMAHLQNNDDLKTYPLLTVGAVAAHMYDFITTSIKEQKAP